ncbi:MAG: hypothetical protein UY58_C0001G0005 [Candidatus Magasanikbacteria bacterium GW2011_GWA2_50_22]|uniref:Uncharacterized protein n=1 Tax=Candidatus Magasanikbacteria bacterium GW2011_GWA2_50_22 TaxID=1619043 RepID=A0A0G1WG25_9BACT|nr:MAG: hypothetical protein UY58_C0001G0005 [Candidatus Magasanikbacteria bacterium GW2011_GWA2_50_22]
MRRYLEPEEGGLGGLAERTPRPSPARETVEQPADAAVVIERSLGQIKAEKEALQRHIKGLSRLVESPSDVRALENLQKRADRLAAEYADKIAALNDAGEEDEVTEVDILPNEMGEVDVAETKESRPAEPKLSAFQERVNKRVAAWKAQLKPVVETTEQKGQFQYLLDEAAKKQPAPNSEIQKRPPPPPEDWADEEKTEPGEPFKAEQNLAAGEELGEKAEALAREQGIKAFLTPEEQMAEQAEEREKMIQLLEEAELDLDIEKNTELRQGLPRDAGDRLVALEIAQQQAKDILHITDEIAPIKEAAWLLSALPEENELDGPEQSPSGNKREQTLAEEKQQLKEGERNRRDLERLSKTPTTARENAGYDALRAYKDYATEFAPRASLPDRSFLETTLALGGNQKKIARELLESYRRYCVKQNSRKKPKMSLEKFVSDNPALNTKKPERREAVNNLRVFFGLKKQPTENPPSPPSLLGKVWGFFRRQKTS